MDPASGFLPSGAANGTAAAGGGGQQQAPPPIREQDRLMPIANVIRIMRRVLPSHAKISDDAKETIQECVSEYISFITGRPTSGASGSSARPSPPRTCSGP